ncbi:MAG: hypothetical protein A2010_11945 [Nitrospirae bacterium GWD2_57_9]|nr:MAG: hypothetical protein A2010_11945 [Nitrospirae bacterium GWD2_57_9]OGW46119.1 MAG: hypothetical protein A2078_12130 [Nitrospirae bacterium GWC2_57_9]
MFFFIEIVDLAGRPVLMTGAGCRTGTRIPLFSYLDQGNRPCLGTMVFTERTLQPLNDDKLNIEESQQKRMFHQCIVLMMTGRHSGQ